MTRGYETMTLFERKRLSFVRLTAKYITVFFFFNERLIVKMNNFDRSNRPFFRFTPVGDYGALIGTTLELLSYYSNAYFRDSRR